MVLVLGKGGWNAFWWWDFLLRWLDAEFNLWDVDRECCWVGRGGGGAGAGGWSKNVTWNEIENMSEMIEFEILFFFN